ncbi:hypothetical protein N7462_000293 [Penicillium macrosclerotiorum]|uniref:uncharacterized protein n=1 Tax=Penicillium macrosclerotiorum TaxID=303699 RepID=UPI00254782C2|nr:uncharacterized protein N7462_000293 [Penicillium macrosclerotiorum]KAJ5698288.1 hypothetical protein N7462_000293 [Penicillium macrosclerotiorum]
MTVSTLRVYLPNDPLLVRLLEAAHRASVSKKVILDKLGFEKTYSDLLGDIVQTRDALSLSLPPWVPSEVGPTPEKDVHVGIISQSAYEFLVAFFAVRAAGGAQGFCLKKVITYFKRQNEQIAAYIRKQPESLPLRLLPISSNARGIPSSQLVVDNSISVNPAGPGMIMFTSGTTGRPKGVILPRVLFSEVKGSGNDQVALNHRPCHWIGGARTSVDAILTGKTLVNIGEKRAESRAQAVIEVLQEYRITDAVFTPALLRWMKQIMLKGGNPTPAHIRAERGNPFRHLSSIKCAAGICEPSTISFLTSLTGLRFETIYGATELGGLITVGHSEVKGSIGKPLPDIDIKLSEGDRGEIRVKSARMFIGYIGDKAATKAVFDEHGYYKTNDLAEYRNGEYIFCGRENTDFVLFRNYGFSSMLVENSILDLDYIAEACVVAVPDHASRQLCGVVARMTPDVVAAGRQIDLSKIRTDLSNRNVPLYMLPVVLKTLSEGEPLPRNVSAKPMKRDILARYFGSVGGIPPTSLPTGVERFDLPKTGNSCIQPWDWCGMQSASV